MRKVEQRPATSVSTNKIPKPKSAPLRAPAIEGRKLAVGEMHTHLDPHSAGEFRFLNIDCRNGNVTWECSYDHLNHCSKLIKASLAHVLSAFRPYQDNAVSQLCPAGVAMLGDNSNWNHIDSTGANVDIMQQLHPWEESSNRTGKLNVLLWD